MNSGLLRLDNVGIIVEDLDGVVAFFMGLSPEKEGQTTVEGAWVDRIIGLHDVKSDIADRKALCWPLLNNWGRKP